MSEIKCGVNCDRAYHWKFVHPTILEGLNIEWRLYVMRGDIIATKPYPEKVVSGNYSPGGKFQTMTRKGRLRTRQYPEHIPVYPKLCASHR